MNPSYTEASDPLYSTPRPEEDELREYEAQQEALDAAASDLEDVEEEVEEGEIPSEGWSELEQNFWSHPRASHYAKVFTIYALGILLLILWTYHFTSQVQQLAQKERQLKDIRFRSLVISAELIRNTHVDNITQRVADYQLPLVPATKPPFLLIDSGQYPLITPQDK